MNSLPFNSLFIDLNAFKYLNKWFEKRDLFYRSIQQKSAALNLKKRKNLRSVSLCWKYFFLHYLIKKLLLNWATNLNLFHVSPCEMKIYEFLVCFFVQIALRMEWKMLSSSASFFSDKFCVLTLEHEEKFRRLLH